MQVNPNTTVLYFVPSEELENARVILTNETTKKDIYDKEVNLDRQSYYYKLTEVEGFEFVDGESYIMEVFEDGFLVYRANLYSNSEPIRERFKTTTPPTASNEYITI